MHLKKIIICGFKSFADKITFEFGEGVTVVVGPNGCGKSNIVDAVRWVLGEQSAKSLRGRQMLDVIFNGSSTRKAMSYAEVTLVFDNSSRMLSVDTDEVSVCRKLYRSGESVYLLNNKSCRLKDIRETFMDTGIGADAYSIIEQGKVESLLQASGDDRRAVFEEAAGISKYKARKKEALRKLDRTEQNVLRVQDIIAEMEKRLRSIKYQAGKARNYQTYSARLNELRTNQFLSEYNQLQNTTDETQNKVTQLQDELVGLTTSVEQAQTKLTLLDHQVDQVVGEISQCENELLQCTGQIGAQEDRIEMGHRRCEELQEMLTHNRQQIQSLRRQSEQLQESMAADELLLEQGQQQLSRQKEELKLLQETRQQSVLELNEYRAELEDEKSGLIDIVRRTAQLHNEINSLDIRRNSLTGQKTRLNDQSGKINCEIEDLLSRRAQLDEKLKQIKQLQQDSQEQLDARRQQMSQLSEDRLICSENLSTAKEYRSGLMSRQQLLADMEAKLEGVDQGVRQILQAKKQNKDDDDDYYYVKGMVAELIQADVTYAGIVEAALADKSQHLVASDSRAVMEDHEKFEGLKGRVRMICLNKLPPFKNGFDFSPYQQVQARLIDVVSFRSDYEKLAWHLLGKTILVDNVQSAFHIAQIAPAGYRFVTLEGEVLEADGTLHLGPQIGQAGLISRKSELRQLDVNIAETDERITELHNQSEQYASQAGHLEKTLQDLRTAIYETRTEEVEARSWHEQIDQSVNRLKHEQPLIVSEISGIEDQISQAFESQTASQTNLDELQMVNKQRQERVDVLEEKIRTLQAEDQLSQDKITNLKVSLGQTQQKDLALREKMTSIESQLQQYRHNITTLQSDLNNACDNYNASQRAILVAESKIADLFLSRQERQQTAGQLRNKRDGMQTEKESLAERIRQQNQLRQELQDRLHETQMQLNEAKLRCDTLVQRAREELDIDLAQRLRDHDLEDMDWDAAAEEIEQLRNKISQLGNINLDAIAEQEELEQRAEYLNRQSADLVESRKQLAQLIEKINVESTERFRASFEVVRANFSELFRKLFGGGKAEIVLEDPDNILECGIDIIVRPPGKQLQSITLLSGGEKTLTAVALLMAIFKSKPSPFCLLDEVDAALDEANNERFNLLVQEFLVDSQFLVITHSRRTMSIADVIYGITMQEQGVSKRVSVRFAGEDYTDQTDVAVA